MADPDVKSPLPSSDLGKSLPESEMRCPKIDGDQDRDNRPSEGMRPLVKHLGKR